MSSFDPVLYTLKAHDAAPLRLTFRATDRPRAEAWQKQLRPKIAELVGGFPARRTALQPQTLEVGDYPGYRRENHPAKQRAFPSGSETMNEDWPHGSFFNR